jgi:hypothetical protein
VTYYRIASGWLYDAVENGALEAIRLGQFHRRPGLFVADAGIFPRPCRPNRW